MLEINPYTGIILYMLIGGILTDYKAQKHLNSEELMGKLEKKFPKIIINLLYNRAFVFAYGCLFGVPAWLYGLKEKYLTKEN